MPRENSFSDGDSGRSLTPDLQEAGFHLSHSPVEATSPTRTTRTSRSTRPPPAPEPEAGPSCSGSGGSYDISGAKTPRDKFKATVRKVIAMHRTSTVLAKNGAAGAEPGIDARKATAFAMYGHIRQSCVIEITDYSSTQHSFGRMSNEQFVNMMSDAQASEREPWAKVRWINIAGVSWDVISSLAIRYDLHPLAVEDLIHQPRGGLLSKVDYYSKHLFLRVLAHTVVQPEDEPEKGHDVLLYSNPVTNHSFKNLTNAGVTGLPRSSSPMHYDEKHDGSDQGALGYTSGRASRHTTMKRTGDVLPLYTERPQPGQDNMPPSDHNNARHHAQMKQLAHAHAIERMKHGDRVEVKINPICIILLRNGTVISISRDSANGTAFTAPVLARLKHRDTSLRNSPDGSFLVQALLDLIVDRAFEVVDAYQAKIIDLEHRVLLRPKMKTVRDLHILQGDLSQHKRTLEPIKTVVYGLRRYDNDRVAAVMSDMEIDSKTPIKGYMSHKAKIYLADVVDHMDYILSSIDMFSGTTENLINYTFNMASNEMNQVMKRLTLATIIFLPLTLLSGYFGMNFNPEHGGFWAVDTQSDAFFWELGIPMVFVMVMIFMWQDIRDMVHYLQKKVIGRKDAQRMINHKQMGQRKHQ